MRLLPRYDKDQLNPEDFLTASRHSFHHQQSCEAQNPTPTRHPINHSQFTSSRPLSHRLVLSTRTGQANHVKDIDSPLPLPTDPGLRFMRYTPFSPRFESPMTRILGSFSASEKCHHEHCGFRTGLHSFASNHGADQLPIGATFQIKSLLSN